MKPIRIAILGIDRRIRPLAPDYEGPPGPAVGAGPIQQDERGEYQVLNYFSVLKIRVPPLHTWIGSYIIRPDYPKGDERGLTIELDPIRP